MLTIIRMMTMTIMMLLMMMIPMACGVSLATEAGTQLSALQLSCPLVKDDDCDDDDDDYCDYACFTDLGDGPDVTKENV